MSNEMIIREVQKLDIYDLKEEQVKSLAVNIIEKINLKQLRDEVIKTCLNLTGVGEPCFGADIRFIALDNQKRLELTNMLLYNFDVFESYVKNFRRNKAKCRENDEYILYFVLKTKDLISTILEYGEFKYKEKQENEKQLLAHQQRLLKEGEEQ